MKLRDRQDEPTKFQGLTLQSDLGEVILPEKTREPRLNSEVLDMQLDGKRCYINKLALTPVLLEVDGVQLFRALGRYMVLTKVNNIHVPFFTPSSGADGKELGKWYPFFGCVMGWLVKGVKEKEHDDNVIYHPAISHVQDLINDNLKIGHLNLDTEGNLTSSEGQSFDVKKYLNYLDFQSTEAAHERDAQPREWTFIRKMTGYEPVDVDQWGDTAPRWIDAIVKQIR